MYVIITMKLYIINVVSKKYTTTGFALLFVLRKIMRIRIRYFPPVY